MRITVSVPAAVAESARALAARTGQSVSALVAAAVERHVEAERRRLAFDAVDALVGTVPPAASGPFDADLDAIRADAWRR